MYILGSDICYHIPKWIDGHQIGGKLVDRLYEIEHTRDVEYSLVKQSVSELPDVLKPNRYVQFDICMINGLKAGDPCCKDGP